MILPLLLPLLDKALQCYKERDSLPESSVFGRTKGGCSKDIAQLIDKATGVLTMSGAVSTRDKIQTLQRDISDSQKRRTASIEGKLIAPAADLVPWFGVFTTTREDHEKAINAENGKLVEMNLQLAEFKGQFRNNLSEIGVKVSEDEIEPLLKPLTQDDIVSMAVVVSNIASLTTEFEKLANECKEDSASAMKYYGMYLLLLRCVDRVHERFIRDIERESIPKLSRFEDEAFKALDEAHELLESSGSRDVLMANIEANKAIIEGCRYLAKALREQKDTVVSENKRIKRLLDVAENTYDTMKLSKSLAELIGQCRNAFQALRQIRIPPLRPIKNLQLEKELQTITTRMLDG